MICYADLRLPLEPSAHTVLMNKRLIPILNLCLLGCSFCLPKGLAQTPTSTPQGSPCGPAGCIVSNDDIPPPATASQSGVTQGTAPELNSATAPNGSPGSNAQIGSIGSIESPNQIMQPGASAPKGAHLPSAVLGPGVQQPLSDFQKFVSDTTGTLLPIFGRNLFLNRPADFVPSASISPPTDYVVGPGDQVKVRVWGNVSMNISATVDRNGTLFLPQVGTVAVAGMRQDQIEGAVRAAMSQHFRNFDLSVTLGNLRSIQVFMLGEARRPGVYTISSLSTLVNALFASGGPAISGSMRDIQLKRGDQVITHFDVYRLLLEGDRSKDVHLLPGDAIYIPVVGPQMAIIGDVQHPAIFELKGNTTADEALQLAGGLTPVSGIERASLDRIVDHTKRTVQDFPLNGPQRLIPVQDGDVLRVFPISPRIDNAVTLEGFVGQPGRYPWHPGMRISDLIPDRRFLVARRYYNQQNELALPVSGDSFASSSDKHQSQDMNSSALSTAQSAAAATTPDLLSSAGSTDLISHETEINWNYAAIERLGAKDLTTHIVGFSLGEAVDRPSSSENKTLESGDVVVIYSVQDVNLPTELRARFIRIDGEVAKPGIYQIQGDDTLRELVTRAGGLSPHAYPYASQLTRESVRIAEDAKLKNLLQLESQAALSPINAAVSPDGKNNQEDLALRRAYLDVLRQVHSTGRVVLQLSPEVKTASQLPEFRLQDGDHYFVPGTPNTVDVLGSVFHQGSFRYVHGERVGGYLAAAGGHTRLAENEHDFVLRADGTVLSRDKVSRFDKLVLFPGDSVIVPGRFKARFNLIAPLSQLASGFALSVLAISALP